MTAEAIHSLELFGLSGLALAVLVHWLALVDQDMADIHKRIYGPYRPWWDE